MLVGAFRIRGAHTPNGEEWGTEEFMESCPVTQSKHERGLLGSGNSA